jgi:AcrR family transcriptional regulator
MTAPVQTQRRNRTETEARILAAARRIIAREGFRGLGIVAVAAEAGCDKKLVTRYFGDLEGLITALGGEVGFWLGAAEGAKPEGSYADRLATLLEAYAASLRADPVLQQALAWELVAPSPAMGALDAARSRAVGAWMAEARGDARPPAGVDAPAVNAVLLAALHYLTLRETSLGRFAGLELDEAGRQRLQDAMRFLLRRAFAAEGAP